MVAFTILAGGYDLFIAAYLFNATSSSLSLLGRFPTGHNPSWITLHPKNRSILYAVNEDVNGALQSFEIGPRATLSGAVSTVSTGGNGPAFAAALSTGEVAAFNYQSGDGRIIPTSSSPLQFDDTAASASVITFPKPVPTVSHPHQAVEHEREVLVPDLGADKIWRLMKTGPRGEYTITGSIDQPPKSGPRHIAIYGDRLFTLHELSSTLSVQTIPAPRASSSIIASVSITPPNPPKDASFAAAEILIPPPTDRFTEPYIYVSNRNTGPTPDPRGDAIAIFEHINKGQPDEGLRLVNQVFTGLDQPRGMVIGPDGLDGAEEYLVAAGVKGEAGVKVFRRIEGGRNLEFVVGNAEIPTRTSFVWVDSIP